MSTAISTHKYTSVLKCFPTMYIESISILKYLNLNVYIYIHIYLSISLSLLRARQYWAMVYVDSRQSRLCRFQNPALKRK